jgi:hypothetical protein
MNEDMFRNIFIGVVVMVFIGAFVLILASGKVTSKQEEWRDANCEKTDLYYRTRSGRYKAIYKCPRSPGEIR